MAGSKIPVTPGVLSMGGVVGSKIPVTPVCFAYLAGLCDGSFFRSKGVAQTTMCDILVCLCDMGQDPGHSGRFEHGRGGGEQDPGHSWRFEHGTLECVGCLLHVRGPSRV